MNVIAKYKIEHGLTVNQIASIIGVSRHTVSSHLVGRCRPRPKTIQRYCSEFGLKPYDVFSICNKSRPADLMGKRFGKLVVVDYLGSEYQRGLSGTSIIWGCKCDCGGASATRGARLMTGRTKSCGCIGLSNLKAGGHNKLDEGLAAARTLMFHYKRSAKARGHIWNIEPELFLELTSADCHYCGVSPFRVQHANGQHNANGSYTYNGIDRIDSAMGYTPDNVRPCCWDCNSAKGKRTEQEFYEWATRLYHHSAKAKE